MNKRNILDDLNKFIDSDYNIILLDGPWGSGKTYLLNEYVKANDSKGVRFYYVSLHGMKNIDEINTNLFMKVHPDAKNINDIVPNVINPFEEEVDTEKTLAYLLKINKLKPNKVVILDDLERYASSDYDAFLSYLTNLIATGCKVIVVSNLLDFGTSELYLFNTYKEKIFDRIYKAELFDKNVLNEKFGNYEKYVDETIVDLSKQNYRLIEKIVLFMNEITAKIKLNDQKLTEKGSRDLLYYATMFISTYYESRRAYLNKVCDRLSVTQERDLKEKSDSEASFLDVNLICIEHINYKLKKPHYDDEYLCFLGLYKAYMYSEYEILLNFLNKHSLIKQ